MGIAELEMKNEIEDVQADCGPNEVARQLVELAEMKQINETLEYPVFNGTKDVINALQRCSYNNSHYFLQSLSSDINLRMKDIKQ